MVKDCEIEGKTQPSWMDGVEGGQRMFICKFVRVQWEFREALAIFSLRKLCEISVIITFPTEFLGQIFPSF